MSEPKIQPIAGELFRFYVPSLSEPNYPRTVDLEDYQFNGACDCQRFKFNCEPKLSRGAAPEDKLRCRHLKDARSFFLDEILPKIAKSIKRIAAPTSLFMEAMGIVTAIHQSPTNVIDKVNDLLEIRKHIDATIEQINRELESAA